jgi:hypothetical protein
MANFERLVGLFAEQRRTILRHVELLEVLKSHGLYPEYSAKNPEAVENLAETRRQAENLLKTYELMEVQTEQHIASLHIHIAEMERVIGELDKAAGTSTPLPKNDKDLN